MKPKKIPMRMCVGCREMKEKRELIRIVRTPEGGMPQAGDPPEAAGTPAGDHADPGDHRRADSGDGTA